MLPVVLTLSNPVMVVGAASSEFMRSTPHRASAGATKGDSATDRIDARIPLLLGPLLIISIDVGLFPASTEAIRSYRGGMMTPRAAKNATLLALLCCNECARDNAYMEHHPPSSNPTRTTRQFITLVLHIIRK